MTPEAPQSLYDAVGGMAFFARLVDRFYAAVESDPALRAMYPDDLAASRASLTQFLAQYFGGPTTYSDAKGHPRLRMRHAHLQIDTPARDGWFRAMTTALADADAPPEIVAAMTDYFDRSATWMINA